MVRCARLAIVAAAIWMLPVAVAEDGDSGADRQLQVVIGEHWEYLLSEHPDMATSAGVDAFNDRMPRVAADDRSRRLAAERRFLARVRDLDRGRLSPGGRIDADLLAWVLEDSIRAYELNLARIPFNTFSGFFMTALTASSGVRMTDAGDYRDYLARLRDIPRYFEENIENLREGVATGFVLPRVVIDGVLPTIRAQVKQDAALSSFYAPFNDMAAAVPQAEQQALKAEAARVISERVMPAFARLADFLESEYRASDSIAAHDMKGGQDYYAFNIKRYTTVEGLTPDVVHEIGLREVARIRAEMEALVKQVGFDGDLAAFSEFLRTDPRFYADSAEALLKEAAWIAKRIDYVMPAYFGKLPRQSYGVVPVPDEIAPNYTTGAYYGAPPGGAHGGEFWVNTHALNQRPLYELPALTLHEAVPGHHHQNALSLELEDTPDFRRNLYFSAFGEGWGLYSEKLGVEMGVYRTPYEDFGRLSYEMWRACRLVVDTGMHAQGWTRDRSIEYFVQNTSLSEANIRAEVDRYISWPGQALAYKLGELKIWELRRLAQQELGSAFDLREFHDVILGHGAVPLDMLEELVRAFIAGKQAAAIN